MGFGWQEIDKTLDLGYIRVAGLHRGCKPGVLFDPPNFHPLHYDTCTYTYIRTYIHMHTLVHTYVYVYVHLLVMYILPL